MKKSTILKILVITIVAAIIFAAGALTIFWANNLPVTLDQQYYDNVEIIDINKDEYNELIADKKSFLIMIDNAGCTTTEKMREMMKSLPQQVTYYRILWPEAKETNLKDYVKYFPSLAVVEKGTVKYYLRADSDDDAKYYNNAADLKSWLDSKIAH